MIDYLLRADSESDMDDVLIAAAIALEVIDENGEVTVQAVEGIALDRIGPIPAQVDKNGTIIRPADNRYHANLRTTIELTADQVAALPTFNPKPSVPYRVFI